MDVIKIGMIGIAGVFLSVLLKEVKPAFSVLISITVCVMIFFFLTEKLQYLADTFQELGGYVSIQGAYLKSLMKILGITYLADFAANICKDAGYHAVAGQIEIFGKLSILAVSTPILAAILEMVQKSAF
ncbi:MAG: SpoIIIAC/SpoIIIAD family protein [Lachnospiraceae bacterium]|nr:stage III sporulation protein AD [Robinsoniella sp.]MDY3766496.1 SpoIIIAC/SpoIIIAD family protein [Lachnospiraceae bacterium]